MAQRAIELGAPPSRVVVHHIGVPQRSETADEDIPDRDRRWDVVFVGRLVDKKGVADMLQAAASSEHAIGRRLRIIVVGDGPRRADLEQRAQELNLDVDFAGMRTPVEVHEILHNARVFCAPSKTGPDGDAEGFGLVFTEAACAALPVVTYAHGGVVDAVADGETGLLAPEGDVRTLTLNLTRLLQDEKLRQQMGVAGRVRARAGFDVAKQTSLLEDIYASVLNSPPSTSTADTTIRK